MPGQNTQADSGAGRKEIRGPPEDPTCRHGGSGGASSPTETSFYIDDLRRKYRSSKLFRKRHLARRDNRLGLGFRKRLIPTRRMMRLLDDLYVMQEKILTRLPVILTNILNDENIEDPHALTA
jgi:hypothetical protein